MSAELALRTSLATRPVDAGAAPRVAVIVPCYNEAVTIAAVIDDFRRALPDAQIFVFDNNSSDSTAAIARDCGARVHSVALQGKGHVVRRQFADVDADIYVMVDGDATYDAASAPRLVQHLRDGRFDMVVAVRQASGDAAYRPGHALGNRMLTGFLAWLFGRPCRDILSGYRVFSRRFAKSFPVLSSGFEIETELTVHALELKMPIGELATAYVERPAGSFSKLSTWRDGFRILRTMLRLFSAERPLTFYGGMGLGLALLAALLAVPLLVTYLDTGLVPRFPTAILSTGLMVLAALSVFAGLILDTVTRGRREMKMLAYLREPGPH
ncbi:glycosyltransferase family 2 protein [Chiayiivirga flava]|uniref:Glycosyltransferase involved in cell wall biosynthesis n=1 Tax=Chiayiivirga flava TaxID=659595 RepID=A0A7W8D7V4_9GAMM|nr:glycosyltransferase family 2 protein [Chiayiivirga flava]MBB5208352.1 glycosyltransferase involved in cell wall biosynthesis [Chiayiivirga flava]